jgi:glycosyltransferase involved in cell wall biosynthesis
VTDEAPVIRLPNPFLDEREFARLQITKQFAIPPSATIVLGRGHASLRNGLDVFIQMAQAVARTTADRPVHFIWIGVEDDECVTVRHGEDGVRFGLADRLHLASRQAHSGLFCAAADVFVLPSREGAFPTVCLEAMEAGLPVVSFEGAVAGGINGDAGVLVPYLDITAMASAVQRLIDNPAERASLGAAGKRRIEDGFELDQYVSFLVGLLHPPSTSTTPLQRRATEHFHP